MKMTIPFQGFYSTVHDMYCEAAVTRDFQDSYGDVYDDFWEKSNVDWPEARRRYAIEYADSLLHALGEARADLKLGREERCQRQFKFDPFGYEFGNLNLTPHLLNITNTWQYSCFLLVLQSIAFTTNLSHMTMMQ